MLERLHNLKIRKKFIVVLVPLVVTIICFDFLQIRNHYLDYADASRLNKAIILGIEINHVVHEIQKERGITAGYISNETYDFSGRLADQRRRTDSTLNEFFNEIQNSDLDDVRAYHSEDLDFLKSYFDRIPLIREQVDSRSITADQAINYFSNINSIALNTVNLLINETRDKDVAQQVHAIIYFLKSKENASIERAIGTHAFSVGSLDNRAYNQFSSLVANQESYLDAFLTITNQESAEFYNKTVQGPEVQEVERMRQALFANEGLEDEPAYWFEMITNKINLLKKVEDFMSDRVHAYTEKIASSARNDLWIYSLIDILVAVFAFWLVTVIITNLLENVQKLENYTRRVSSGDMSHKVFIPTNDEIGHYANTFNVMVEEINKTHKELKKERDRAKYLYKNIYRVSQVVFENIQQGIFLLDKNFRISKFHSKAMRKIFENDHIAGENFANFMRPMIIPRELEALEMFMRHLFNTDMDEEVVNQLNPVEQVKIFTDHGGVVNTKYVRITFTRIERKGVIQNIMVTVSDETESVLLAQHLEEAEAKKKRETEQVLSILKIDPSVLRGFLSKSRKMLKEISEKYEKEGNQDLRKLLDFTFEAIHNLKGNALVIGLELMSNKFHDIEDSISKLSDREVMGKDFLTILYEMDEADGMLEDMAEMLKKVANIYKKFPAEGQVVSNIMVIDSLTKGLDVMSKELKKPAELHFVNEKNLVIPDPYISPFKDIMIQLMRNSLSHGFETPDERMAEGKPMKGSITITLDEKEDDVMEINYKDDGQGLDLKKIKDKAVSRDIISELDAGKLKQNEVLELLFHKGFSTADKVDNYSGRGQGLSLVKTIIEDKKGSYTIKYNRGKFFEIIITLPIHAEEEIVS